MKRKSPVQQWVDSLPPQENNTLEKPTSHNDDGISVTDETCDVASLKLDVDGEESTSSTPRNKNNSPVPCPCQNSDAKEDEKINEHDKTNGETSVLKNDSQINSNKKAVNGNCTNHSNGISDSVKKSSSENIEQKEKLLLYSKSVDSGGVLQRSKAPLFRDQSVNSEGNSPKHRHPLRSESSIQSDTSRASSVESLLEARKVDAEAVLRGVGFGPSPSKQQLARIPDRFLGPSQVKGVSTEQFIKDEQKSIKMHDCGVFGYKGLTGDPHAPKSTIVAKIIERISSREELPEQPFLPTPRSRRNTNTY